MLSLSEATSIVRENLPDGEIKKYIEYRNLYIFQVLGSDPDEGLFDPFFSVNKDNGEFRDYSILTDGDPGEISELFKAAQRL
jgi:hypothetical protein